MSHQIGNFFLLFPLIHLFFIKSNCSSVDYGTNSTNCPSSICGRVTIGYPFWRLEDNRASRHCGYPGFGVNCTTVGGIPIISLTRDTYHIRNINYDTCSLTLVDNDVANQRCPRPRNNITLGNLYFNFSPLDLNLTFHFNCTAFVSSTNRIPCLGSGAYRTTYVTVEDEYEDSKRYEHCDEKVITTVIHDDIDLNREDRDLGVVIGEWFDRGFVLNWMPDDKCLKCEETGGQCGYESVSDEFLCFCSHGFSKNHCKGSGSRNFTFHLKIMLGGVALMVGISSVVIIYCYRSKYLAFFRLRPKNDSNFEAFITQCRFTTPKRYKYREIKRMTNAFKDELGQGGFGSVFKGTLADGSLVAVKLLKKSKGSGEDFINEVASIGRTSHVNIVALKGFCYEGPKRALVYEFMPNGSLEKFIFQNIPKDNDEQYLRVEKLYEIALGIARGLEYLHRGCSTRILHFDIKPHNILLDEEFCPKISDFGLAKLHLRKESIISMVEAARGTIGYIAPEVYNRNFGGVSHKSDVYSYGMMVVEMVGGRKNLDVGVFHSSEIYFPQWIYKRLDLDEDLQLLQQGPMTAVENEIARKMIIVGLWCIQADPSKRPSMNKVIEMLEGSTDALTIPPNPFFSSSPRLPATSSTTLESISHDENLQIG